MCVFDICVCIVCVVYVVCTCMCGMIVVVGPTSRKFVNMSVVMCLSLWVFVCCVLCFGCVFDDMFGLMIMHM